MPILTVEDPRLYEGPMWAQRPLLAQRDPTANPGCLTAQPWSWAKPPARDKGRGSVLQRAGSPGLGGGGWCLRGWQPGREHPPPRFMPGEPSKMELVTRSFCQHVSTAHLLCAKNEPRPLRLWGL